jgi:tetratricopeptide (TPR) repeat protein
METVAEYTEKELREQLQERFMARTSLLDETDKSYVDLEDTERTLGQGFYRLAKVYYDKADLENAEDYFLRALDKTVYPKDAFAMLKIYGFVIRIYSESLQEREASRFILLAEDLVEKFGKDLGSLGAEYFYNVGMIFTYKGDFDQALEHFKLSYQKAQTENEPELIAKALYSISNACFQAEKYSEALSYLDQLKQLLNILKKGFLKGSMHMLYGNIYKEMGKYSDATENYDNAISLLQQKNCWNLFGYILLGKGVVLKKMGEFNQALTLFNLGLNSINHDYGRLRETFKSQVADVNDSSVDLYLDRHNRVIHEKSLGTIDFKHRFVLLEILFLVAKNPGSSFNKEDLAKSIWKDEYNPLIHDKLIYTSISRLRKLIEPKGGNRKYILRGKDGYTFNPRVNARFHKEDDSNSRRIIGNIDISSPV